MLMKLNLLVICAVIINFSNCKNCGGDLKCVNDKIGDVIPPNLNYTLDKIEGISQDDNERLLSNLSSYLVKTFSGYIIQDPLVKSRTKNAHIYVQTFKVNKNGAEIKPILHADNSNVSDTNKNFTKFHTNIRNNTVSQEENNITSKNYNALVTNESMTRTTTKSDTIESYDTELKSIDNINYPKLEYLYNFNYTNEQKSFTTPVYLNTDYTPKEHENIESSTVDFADIPKVTTSDNIPSVPTSVDFGHDETPKTNNNIEFVVDNTTEVAGTVATAEINYSEINEKGRIHNVQPQDTIHNMNMLKNTEVVDTVKTAEIDEKEGINNVQPQDTIHNMNILKNTEVMDTVKTAEINEKDGIVNVQPLDTIHNKNMLNTTEVVDTVRPAKINYSEINKKDGTNHSQPQNTTHNINMLRESVNIKFNYIDDPNQAFRDINDIEIDQNVNDNLTDYLDIDYVDIYKDTVNDDVEYTPSVYVPTTTVAPKITINQNPADKIESVYPWIATVFVMDKDSKQFEYICDGVLLSKRVVLTAARCVIRANATVNVDNVLIILGKRSLQSTGDNEKVTRVISIKVHDSFISTEEKADNDLAIAVLAAPVEFNVDIQPAPLRIDHKSAAVSTVTTGWQIGGSLQPIYLGLQSTEKCKMDANCNKLICATMSDSETTCPSYGGLLVQRHSNDHWRLKGIASGNPTNMGLCFNRHLTFTNIDNYLDWIEKYILMSYLF
ncbi:uncharacterized protein LOC125242265 isoform X1 [Leguminivora glycinivorella]|uniref:uncharacterized protein LOC125242265 isoform X1 n=1 Tax=Leguminivora glycinivorella TaxID=1035111 RepID=UPI00200CAA0A|nr:uncharacterized protein LOC125242265 isoform X1 [Leguminivora glycinivorella]